MNPFNRRTIFVLSGRMSSVGRLQVSWSTWHSQTSSSKNHGPEKTVILYCYTTMHEHHVASTATDLTTVSTVLHLLQCPGFYALQTEFKQTHSELVLSGRKQCMQPALKNVRPGWKKKHLLDFCLFAKCPKYCFNVERIETWNMFHFWKPLPRRKRFQSSKSTRSKTDNQIFSTNA